MLRAIARELPCCTEWCSAHGCPDVCNEFGGHGGEVTWTGDPYGYQYPNTRCSLATAELCVPGNPGNPSYGPGGSHATGSCENCCRDSGWCNPHCVIGPDVDACETHPCQNRGVCVDAQGEDVVNGQFNCICNQGWTGEVCSEPSIYDTASEAGETWLRVPETCSNFVELLQWIDAVQIGCCLEEGHCSGVSGTMTLPAAESQCAAAGCADIFMPFVEQCHEFAAVAGLDVEAMGTYYTSCLRLSGSCGAGCSQFNLNCRAEDVTRTCCGESDVLQSGCGPGYYNDPRIPCPEGTFCAGTWERNDCTVCTPCFDCEDGFLSSACGIGDGPDHGMNTNGVCHVWEFCTGDEMDCHPNAACMHLGPGQHSCQCDAGFIGDGTRCNPVTHDDLKCAPCPAGYADTDGNPGTPCEPCPVGSYAPEFSTSCSQCPEGFHDNDLDPATPCDPEAGAAAPGMYCAPGNGQCSSCAAGTADTDGDPATPCYTCTPGTYADVGATACLPCRAGTADVDSDPATPCITCEDGAHAAYGSVTCTLLPSTQAVCAGQLGMDFGGNPIIDLNGELVECGFAPTVMIIADDEAWPIPSWYSGTEVIDESMTSALDCQARCYENSECEFFSYEYQQREGGSMFHTCYLKAGYMGASVTTSSGATESINDQCNENPYVPWASEDPRWRGQSGPGIACSGIAPDLGVTEPNTCPPGQPVPTQCNIDCAAILHTYLEECHDPLVALDLALFHTVKDFDDQVCQTLTPEPFLERIAAVQESLGCVICTDPGGCAIADDTAVWTYYYIETAACSGTECAGSPVPQDDCLQAARLAVEAAGHIFPDPPRGILQNEAVGSSGCSVQAGDGDWAAYWNPTDVPFNPEYPPVHQADSCPQSMVCAQSATVISNGTRTDSGHRRLQSALSTFLRDFINADDTCPWDEVDERVQIVSDACCDSTDPNLSCEAQVPRTCSIQCAVQAHKFYTDCHTFLLSHFEFGELVKTLEGNCLLGSDLNQLKAVIGEAACI